MSYWDSKRGVIVRHPPEAIDGYPGWVRADCGCCAGIQWSSGYEARECDRCWGGGWIAVHLATGTVALYPGGPVTGAHLSDRELVRLRDRAGEVVS